MFSSPEDLEPDLEWMLGSGQVSKETLLQALLNEYYAPVCQLALATLGNERLARQATIESFTVALLNLHRYQHEAGIRAWLYPIALEIIKKADARRQAHQRIKSGLPGLGISRRQHLTPVEAHPDTFAWAAVDALLEPERIILLLHVLLDWPEQHIAAALGSAHSEVTALLGALRAGLFTPLWESLNPSPPNPQDKTSADLDAWLKHALQARWPVPQPSQTELAGIAQKILGHANWKDAHRRVANSAKELVFVAITVLVIGGIIWGMNTLSPEEIPTPTGIPATLITDIVYIPHFPMPAPEDFFYTVRDGDTLPAVAATLGTTIQELRTLNRLPEDSSIQPGELLLIPGLIQAGPYPTPTPIRASLEPQPLGPPYPIEEIRQRMETSPFLQWSTFWLDAYALDYGPQGYIGPPKIVHSQSWLGPPQSFNLIGATDTIMEVWQYDKSQFNIARPAQGRPWFVQSDGSSPRSLESLQTEKVLENIFSSGESFPDARLEVQGHEQIAGRETLVIGLFGAQEQLTARIWMDNRTGLVLRKQDFGGKDGQTVTWEMVVNQVAYNVAFPPELFDANLPWRGGYALDYTGKPIPVAAQPTPPRPTSVPAPGFRFPPDGFDLSQARLVFHYSRDFNGYIPDAMVNVYADDYYLGKVLFGNPWTMICQRSPDGKRIAYVSKPSLMPSQEAAPQYFSLEGRGPYTPVRLEGIAVTQLAFSPDSTRLAFLGSDGSSPGGSIYIWDLQTPAYKLQLKLADAKSLVWSPDGQYLGMIARYQAFSYDDYVVVVDVKSGKEFYSSSVDYETGSVPTWPMLDWGVEFPVEMGGFEQCAAPPG